MITLIATIDPTGHIRSWSSPTDYGIFQQEVSGGVLIMDHRMWEQLPQSVFDDCMGILISTDPDAITPAGVLKVADVDKALKIAWQLDCKRIYGIGGAGIFEALIDKADRLVLTHALAAAEDPSELFPIRTFWSSDRSYFPECPTINRVTENLRAT